MLRPTPPIPPNGPERRVIPGRVQDLGGLAVRRLIPTVGRRTVGPWCFADHFGPVGAGADVLPHPHVGLATVTWLLAGEMEHRDSLGVVQRIRPGQLNVMTAGRGVVHAELAVPHDGPLHGVQLWFALPAEARHGEPSFVHLPEVPILAGLGWTARVFVGTLGEARSPAPLPWPALGAEVRTRGPVALPLDPTHEHAWWTVEGEVEVDGGPARIGELVWLGDRREALSLGGDGAGILLGGRPFEEPLLTWWNWVVRDEAELRAAHAAWESGALPAVPEVAGRVAAPPLPR